MTNRGRAPVTLVSVHFESHGDPAQRASQIGRLIEAIETYAPGRPVLIGGDLNTSTVSRDWARGTGVKPVLPEERVLDPVPFEPMFEVAAAHGYDWRACNALNVPTQRTRAGRHAGPAARQDRLVPLPRPGRERSRDRCPPSTPAASAISDHERAGGRSTGSRA